MKVGDRLDALAIGHRDIDVKTMLKESGYVVPQVSMAKLPEMPTSVAAALASAKEMQRAYTLGTKVKRFQCKVCGAECSAQEKLEVASGQRFFACGACDVVEEVL